MFVGFVNQIIRNIRSWVLISNLICLLVNTTTVSVENMVSDHRGTGLTHLGEDGVVELAACGHLGEGLGAQDEGRGARGEGRLAVELRRQCAPVLQADLEDLHLLHLRYHDQVMQGLQGECIA